MRNPYHMAAVTASLRACPAGRPLAAAPIGRPVTGQGPRPGCHSVQPFPRLSPLSFLRSTALPPGRYRDPPIRAQAAPRSRRPRPPALRRPLRPRRPDLIFARSGRDPAAGDSDAASSHLWEIWSLPELALLLVQPTFCSMCQDPDRPHFPRAAPFVRARCRRPPFTTDCLIPPRPLGKLALVFCPPLFSRTSSGAIRPQLLHPTAQCAPLVAPFFPWWTRAACAVGPDCRDPAPWPCAAFGVLAGFRVRAQGYARGTMLTAAE